MRESVIEQHLITRAKERGGRADKFKNPGRRNAPDRQVLLPGRMMFFAEIKKLGEPPNDAQLREHERLRSLGFPVLVLDSTHAIDEVFDGASSFHVPLETWFNMLSDRYARKFRA